MVGAGEGTTNDDDLWAFSRPCDGGGGGGEDDDMGVF
jgi:hypothetical protein